MRHNPLWRRKLASVSRWLHIYLSMFSFAVLLFFAVTGLTLNHQSWFEGQERTTEFRGTVDRKWLAGDVSKLEIVEYLRQKHRITGALHDFRVDDTQCSVSFKGAGLCRRCFHRPANGLVRNERNAPGLLGGHQRLA